jgi:hypothetical protein
VNLVQLNETGRGALADHYGLPVLSPG